MRILFITHFFPPTHNAGTENYTFGLAKAFMTQGHEVMVLCAEGWNVGEHYWNGVSTETYNNVLVYRIHLNWVKANNPNKVLYYSAAVENWLDQFLDENHFDIVHVTSLYSLGVGVLRSLSRAGIPTVLTLTDFWFICPSVQLLRSDGNLCDGKTTAQECRTCLMAGSHLFQKYHHAAIPESAQSRLWETLSLITMLTKQPGFRGMFLNMSERKQIVPEALTLPDLLLTPSKFVQQMFLQDLSLPVQVLNHGHSLDWLENFRKDVPSYTVRFGYIGQIHPTKGIHILIEAFQKANIGQQASLDMWGDTAVNKNYVNILRSLIDNNPSIHLQGRYEHDQLATVLAGIDVMVVPSLWYENAPLVIQEAFAAGIPVIATDLGGMAEAVTNEMNGLLFERGNANDLATKLARFIQEPELLGRLQSGIPAVKTVGEEVDELREIYGSLIAKRKLSYIQKAI